MAFTSAQQVLIRQYLGYPTLFRYRDSRLESAIAIVGADPDASAAVLTILSAIAAVDGKTTSDLEAAGLKRVDEVEWYPAKGGDGQSATMEADAFRGRQFCSRLSQLMGIPLWGDYWGTRGYPGDEFMGVAHQYGGGGILPLG